MSSVANKNTAYSPSERFGQLVHNERVNALFSPIRKDSSNDQDSTSKLSFWSSLIHDYLRFYKKCSFSISEIELEAVECTRVKPQCLIYVIDAMLSSGEIVAEEEFMKLSSETWGSWAVNVLVKSPSWWIYKQLKGFVGSKSINSETKFIHVQNAKILANTILNCTSTELDNKAVSFDHFFNILKDHDKDLDEVTARHVLICLYKMKKAVFYPLESDRLPVLVKVSKHKVFSVTSQELAIQSLKTKEQYLMHEIKELEKKQMQVLEDIRQNLKQNRKQAAKILLKKKKEIERILQVRSNALIGIETMLMRISDAHMNLEMIEGYSMASDVLKSYKQDITEDKIIDVQDDLCEKFEEVLAMEKIVAESVGNPDIDDADLEQELAELLEDIEQKQQPTMELPDLTKHNLKDLPSDKMATVQTSGTDKTLPSQNYSL